MSTAFISSLAWVPVKCASKEPQFYQNLGKARKSKKGKDDGGDGDGDEMSVGSKNTEEEMDLNEKEEEDMDEKEFLEEEEFSDVDDYKINDSDRIIVTANTEDDYSTLEMQVYDSETGNLFVHHDISLQNFALSLCQLDLSQSISDGKKNLMAVGTFAPTIEIWNLDIVNAFEPISTLDKQPSPVETTETEEMEDNAERAIMCLDFCKESSILAAGSAENLIKIWDLKSEQTVKQFSLTDKVQVVKFCPTEQNILLAGCFDHTACIFDLKNVENTATDIKMKVDSKVESGAWGVSNPFQVFISTEEGKLSVFDIRSTKKEIISRQLHKKGTACAAVTINSRQPNLLATAGNDKSVKIIDIQKFLLSDPKRESDLDFIIHEKKDYGVGQLFTASWCPDEDLLLAAAGDEGVLALWDLSDEIAMPSN